MLAGALLAVALIAGIVSATAALPRVAGADVTLLNVSYDPTHALYKEYDALFAEHWRRETGKTIAVVRSHGGSGAQARAVIDGLRADVVTLALEEDIDAISRATGKIALDWRDRLPHRSAPYQSTIVFLVRKGNPKGIADWGDLIRNDVAVITPNPKTSGGARWNYLAAWAWAHEEFGGDEAKMAEYVAALYRHVPVLDAGARGSASTFVQRGIGDVLLAWENEAYLARDELGADRFDIVVPSISVLAEPSVAVVDANAAGNGTGKVAAAYLAYLYSDEGQALIARHYYRPADPDRVDPALLRRFASLRLVPVDDPLFGGWPAVMRRHFAEGGLFDRLYQPGG